jgi:cyclopropane fatty-acyl-phospholipid synthase-like methyltransferase
MSEVNLNGFEINMGCVVFYRRCLYCGMIWQSPRLSDESLERWYSEGHYRVWLGQPQIALDKDEYERAEKTVRWIDAVQPGEITSFMDFGCSRGYLLDMLSTSVPDVLGVEDNLDYVNTKHPVVRNLNEVKRAFELITAIHVLEHMVDPLVFLLQIQQYMTPGGLLLLEIPSTSSKGGPFRLAHMTYMEPAVLSNLCIKAGLKVLSVSISEDWHTRVVCTNGLWEGEENVVSL